jgi:CxxC-x17-CxxC domain-containing protein
MRNYNRDKRSGRGRRGGGGRDFGRRDSRPKEMHKAVCDNCGNDCEVPFRPSKDKPIYCSDCFERKEGGGSRRPDRRDSRRSGGGERDNTNRKILEQLTSLNSKLNRILIVMEPKIEKKEEIKEPQAKKVVKKETKKEKKEEKTKKAPKKK